jgi:DNA helicase-2/ATP-dependent DNA helicase PcrA
VVGDEDQSIYRWRGADSRNVLRFEEDYPACQKILLEQNYRSTQTVLDAARMVIDRNPYRTPKHLSSARGVGGERITLFEAADDHAEAAYVVDYIGKQLAGGKGQGGDFAVMYRTNAQSRLLEEAFLHTGYPYRLVGALRFYGRREVKDIIAFLRLAQNPTDEVSLLRVINVPGRGIGDKTLVTLQLAARLANSSPGGVLLDLGRNGQDSPFWKTFSGRGAAVLADFGALLTVWNDASAQATLPILFDRILADTVYQEYINDDTDEGKDRWANVQELRKLAYDYQERGLTAFLENVALVSDQDTLPDQTNVPTLLTLHAAKGLEFKQVFIVGLDEGLLPHSRSMDDPEEMAEERRLFYVGVTRTKDRLFLVRTGQRSTYGSFEYCEPSRFLNDIPAQLLQVLGAPRPVRRRSDDDWGSSSRQETPRGSRGRFTLPPPSAPIIEMRYHQGMRVRHPVWGEGLILESKIIDGEETVDATFESVGFKRLIAALAKLETIS